MKDQIRSAVLTIKEATSEDFTIWRNRNSIKILISEHDQINPKHGSRYALKFEGMDTMNRTRMQEMKDIFPYERFSAFTEMNESEKTLSFASKTIGAASRSEERVAICFFGQVKNYKHVAGSVQRHVFAVLDAAGLTYDIYAHTFNQSTFTNARNLEQSVPIDPSSLQSALSLPPSAVLYDDPAAADRRANLTALLRHGDPWPENPVVSLRNYARQLHSLRRVTSLWAPRAARYSWVLYLRPDLRFLSHIDLPALRAALREAGAGAGGAIAAPGFARWGGLNDRLAFGTPGAMAAYGRRGDALEGYVAAEGRRPCSEAFLGHRMAQARVAAVESGVRFQRIRADGRPELRDGWLAGPPDAAGRARAATNAAASHCL